MKEVDRILRLWERAKSSGESAVLATVVETRGSSYRMPGARLLLTANGERAGSVSGGCLEDDLIKKAWWLTESGSIIKRYDTTPEGEIGSGFGLGCSGIIHVLLERLHPADRTILEAIQNVRSDRRAAVVAHCILPVERAGTRLVIDSRGHVTHNLTDAMLASSLEQAAKTSLDERCSRKQFMSTNVHAFVEVITPPVRLLVFGGGDDSIPVTEMAKFLGWEVIVLDGRANYGRRERFPNADSIIFGRSSESARKAETDPWTAAVLMSHSYSQDLDTLRELLDRDLAYLGVLGPKKRTRQLIADAELDRSRSRLVHSPMGLDIGADGPEQVALAVIAEIQAVLNGRAGGLLRERIGSIHSREEDSADREAVWLQPTCV